MTKQSFHPLRAAMTLSILAVVLFALNLFVLGPWMTQAVSAGAANITYLVIRLLVFIGLGFGLCRWGARNRFQTMSTVMLVAFLDQVLMKGLLLLRDARQNPAAWEGVTEGAIFYGVSTGFLFFAPFVLILTFLGYELARYRRAKEAA